MTTFGKEAALPKLDRFLRRHAWSVSLTTLSVFAFLYLTWEMQEGALRPFDASVSAAFAGFRGRFDGAMLAFTGAGGFVGMTILCVASVAVFSRLKKPREATFMAVCGLGALALSSGLKLALHRARPDASALYLIAVPDSFSFPSGHALGTTSVVGALAIVGIAWLGRLGWRVAVGLVSLLCVLGVAASRVYFGVHFPSDVIGGMLAGAAWVAAVTGWFYPRLLPGEVSGEGR